MELAKQWSFEDAGGAKGSQMELQLSPRGAQRRAKGAKREPKQELLLHIFLSYLLASFWDFFVDGFRIVFRPVLEHFGWSFWVPFRTLRKRPDPTKVL